jgi:hypothetical protein
VRRRGPADDRGETLVELLVAIIIMGTASIAVVGGLASGILMSTVHRRQATMAVKLNEYADLIENTVTNSGYRECADETAYPVPAGFPGPPYLVEVERPVQFWNDALGKFTPSCTSGSDPGVQLLTLHIYSVDAPHVDRTMQVIIRKPCRPADSSCG